MEVTNQVENEIVQTWSIKEDMGNGIWVYRDVLPKELDLINRLENVLGDKNNAFNWQPAYVGYMQRMPEYRDCVDFKYKKENLKNQVLYTIHPLSRTYSYSSRG